MQLGQHQVEDIKEGTNRFRCTLCGQQWTKEPRSACAGVPTYKAGEVPEGFYSMSRMRVEFRRQTDWDQPHAAVRKLRAPYLLMLYDIHRCEPIPLSAAQEKASEKRRQTLHDRWTCWFCNKYHRHRWQQEKFHTDLQMCEGCYAKIEQWNKQIAWAQERIQENAQIAVFTYEPGPGFEKGTLTNIEIMHLDGSLVPQPETFDPDAFFTALMAISTIYAPHSYDHLYQFCDQQRYHMWETHHEFEFGVPLVRTKDGAWINVTWHGGLDIYRRAAITDPYLHLCELWGIAVDEQVSQAEKMRRVIFKVAEQEPLERTAPPAAEKAS